MWWLYESTEPFATIRDDALLRVRNINDGILFGISSGHCRKADYRNVRLPWLFPIEKADLMIKASRLRIQMPSENKNKKAFGQLEDLYWSSLFVWILSLHRERWAEIVAKVSPSCVSTVAARARSSSDNRQAMELASAVTLMVNSHEFIKSPRINVCDICSCGAHSEMRRKWLMGISVRASLNWEAELCYNGRWKG